MHSRRTLQSTPAAAPSFNAYSAIRLGQIAARVIRELALEDEENEAIQTVESPPDNFIDRISGIENSDQEPGPHLRDPKITEANGSDSDDFEFTFFPHDPAAESIPADELFSDGKFRPMFPVFNGDLLSADGSEVRLPVRKILNEDRDPATSSSDATADAVPEQLPTGSFCVWASRSVPPSPSRCKKSNSTGSTKLWKFRDLLHRSSSDGKETFLFLSPAATAPVSATRAPASTKEVKTDKAKGKKVNSGDATMGKVRSVASAHELLYVRNRAMKEEDRRRSFLPYRQDIVGFFGNVNGLSRTFLPF